VGRALAGNYTTGSAVFPTLGSMALPPKFAHAMGLKTPSGQAFSCNPRSSPSSLSKPSSARQSPPEASPDLPESPTAWVLTASILGRRAECSFGTVIAN
jgi:hypothetical protein